MKVLNYLAVFIFVVLAFYLLYIGKDLLLPLVIAIALWYLIFTLGNAFSHVSIAQFQFPKPVCLMASFFTFVGLAWLVINFLSSTVDDVLEIAPVYQENLNARLESLAFVDIGEFEGQSFGQLLSSWIDIPAYARSIASSLTSILASGGLILIYLGFLFLEQGHFNKKIAALVSDREREEDINKLLHRIRDDIQKYVIIKVFTSSLTGILSYVFLRFMEVDFAGVWGLIIFLLNFIPTVGSIVATIFPALIAFETLIPLARLEVYTPDDNPYWLSFILETTSSSVLNFITDKTGPNNSFSATGKL